MDPIDSIFMYTIHIYTQKAIVVKKRDTDVTEKNGCVERRDADTFLMHAFLRK